MHHLDQTIAFLSRTPAVLNALLRELPDAWTLHNEGEKTWSAYDIVGHLIYCEIDDWMPRARRILVDGEAKPFEPFDRWGHLKLVEGKALPQLIDEFAARRAANLDELRSWNLTEADIEKRGRHPRLGSLTLSELLATWAAHDLNHLHQMSRVMAHQYREAVGPFRAYLGVMQCTAHGAL
jgi:DinB family protein